MEKEEHLEIEIDELDRRIITELQDNGRKPSTEIARRLGVPRPTVARRIDRLVNQKVITVGAFANGQRIGLPIHVMILINVAPQHHECVLEAIVALDEVRWVGVATGPFDLLIEGMLRSNDHLQQFLLKKLGAIEGITRMQTAHILEVAKIAFDWERMRLASEDATPHGGQRGNPAPHCAVEGRAVRADPCLVTNRHRNKEGLHDETG